MRCIEILASYRRYGLPASSLPSTHPLIEPLEIRQLLSAAPTAADLKHTHLTAAHVVPVALGESYARKLAKLTGPSNVFDQSNLPTVQIDWGDGTSVDNASLDSIAPKVNLINGNHLFASAGTFTAKVSFLLGGAVEKSVAETIHVGPTQTQGRQLTAKVGKPFTGILGWVQPDFARQDHQPVPGRILQIDWGDGTIDNAFDLPTHGSQRVAVRGSHTYTTAGTYTVTVERLLVPGAAPTRMSLVTLGAPVAEVFTGTIIVKI